MPAYVHNFNQDSEMFAQFIMSTCMYIFLFSSVNILQNCFIRIFPFFLQSTTGLFFYVNWLLFDSFHSLYIICESTVFVQYVACNTISLTTTTAVSDSIKIDAHLQLSVVYLSHKYLF